MTASSSPLRVLYILNFDTGGSVVSLRTLVAHLDRERFEPVVLFYRSNAHCDEFRRLGVEVHTLEDSDSVEPLPRAVAGQLSPLKRFRSVGVLNQFVRKELRRAVQVARLGRRIKADLVSHNDNLRAHRGSILGIATTGIPQVCHVRSLTDHFGLLDVPLARTVDHFAYISNAVAEHCQKKLHVRESKGTTVWNPVEMDALSDPEAARLRIRKELGFGLDHRIVTNVGRIIPGKGQDHFLEAMARVAAEHPDVRVVLVGAAEGGGADERFVRRLQQLAEQDALRGRVRFTGHRQDVPEIMAASDLVVHSARSPEGLGRVLVEALALERPVVATDTGGVGDVIRHGETGFLVPPSRPGELATAIGHVLENPDEARATATRGRDFVRSRFTIETHVRTMERLYAEVVG